MLGLDWTETAQSIRLGRSASDVFEYRWFVRDMTLLHACRFSSQILHDIPSVFVDRLG